MRPSQFYLLRRCTANAAQLFQDCPAFRRPQAPLMPVDWLTDLGARKRKQHQESEGHSEPGRIVPKTQSQPAQGAPGVNDLGSGSFVVYIPGAISPHDCKHLMGALQRDVHWAERAVRILGKEVMQPRMVAYMANDTSQEYTYSGARFMPDPWDPFVLKIKEEVEKHTEGLKFNSCLLNYYRNGSDHIGWHSDDETLYGSNATIGSVSLGAARDFVMRNRSDHNRKITFSLGQGDILIMRGTTQTHWAHCVPKRTKLKDSRINLTFRKVL